MKNIIVKNILLGSLFTTIPAFCMQLAIPALYTQCTTMPVTGLRQCPQQTIANLQQQFNQYIYGQELQQLITDAQQAMDSVEQYADGSNGLKAALKAVKTMKKAVKTMKWVNRSVEGLENGSPDTAHFINKALSKAAGAKKAAKRAKEAAKWEQWIQETAAMHFTSEQIVELIPTARKSAESVEQYRDGSFGPKAAKKANKATKWAEKAISSTPGEMKFGMPAVVYYEKKATSKAAGAKKAAKRQARLQRKLQQ